MESILKQICISLSSLYNKKDTCICGSIINVGVKNYSNIILYKKLQLNATRYKIMASKPNKGADLIAKK